MITKRIIVFLFTLLVPLWATAQEEPVGVDMMISIGIDTSSSMDSDYIQASKEKLADALEHPETKRHLENQEYGRIAVMIYYWDDGIADTSEWMVIEPDTLSTLADFVRQGYNHSSGRTATGIALKHARDMFLKHRDQFKTSRRHAMIIGDGTKNKGVDPQIISIEMHKYLKVTVSGVSIIKDEKNRKKLLSHYHNDIKRGQGGFVAEAYEPEDYRNAFIRAILMETYHCTMKGVC